MAVPNRKKHTIILVFCWISSIAIAMTGCAFGAGKHRGDFLQELQTIEEKFSTQQENEKTRLQLAQKLFETGNFSRTRETLTPLLNTPTPSVEAMLLKAQVEFLFGNYGEAEELLHSCIERAEGDVWERIEPEAYLTYVYYQTNQYAKAAKLFQDMDEALKEVRDALESTLALWELMKAFGQEPPNQINWNGKTEVHVPFLQTEDYELPVVAVEINGHPVQAYIDTGGDIFSIPRKFAETLGMTTDITSTGTYAGGEQAEIGFAIADSLKIGDVVIRNLPIEITPEDRCCLGTGILRQFLSTLDYPKGRLILRPKSQESQLALRKELTGRTVTEIPFMLMATHLILAQGTLNDQDGLLFLVDSGLEDDSGEGSAFTAPIETLTYTNIPVPPTISVEGSSGVGQTNLELGPFPIEQVGLGTLIQKQTRGVYGLFPPQLYHDLGFLVDGLISHNYLRFYAWTLDFSTMKMIFAQ